eukprot:1158393-Pelagomonas_calceolata.AAC.2
MYLMYLLCLGLAQHARSAAMAAQHQPRMQQNAADVGKRAADYNQLLQQQPGPPPAKLGAEEHGDWKYGHQEGMDLGRPSIVVPADEEKMSRVGRGLKQDLPPEVLAKLAEMGLSEDDVEVRLQLSFDAIARAAKSKKAWIIGAKGVGGPALNDRIVQYPPGTDPDAALNDFYSRQAGGGGRGGVGGGGRSYSTAVPPSQTYEQPRSALDGFFSEDLFEIPAILAFELMDSARNLAPFLQESFGGSGTGYASQLSDWTSSNNGMSSNSSNSIDISLPGVLSDGEEEKKEGGKGSGDEKEDGNGDDEEGGQKNKKEEVQDSLTSIWDDYKKKVAREDGKNINASTLCKCSSEGKVAVCCAGARQYASNIAEYILTKSKKAITWNNGPSAYRCEAECVNEDMGICTAGAGNHDSQQAYIFQYMAWVLNSSHFYLSKKFIGHAADAACRHVVESVLDPGGAETKKKQFCAAGSCEQQARGEGKEEKKGKGKERVTKLYLSGKEEKKEKRTCKPVPAAGIRQSSLDSKLARASPLRLTGPADRR